MNRLELITPELILVIAAGVLMMLGISNRIAMRRSAPLIALGALLIVFIIQLGTIGDPTVNATASVVTNALSNYIKLIAAGVGILLVLLAWPTNATANGSRSMDLGPDVGEFFSLMLLSITGLMLASSANDIILLFLAIELASIPTYVMVSMSRPLAVAQEAGVKYFFLGAMAAAVMLFGFSYLYGTTGLTRLDEIEAFFTSPNHEFTLFQQLALVMMIAGFAFKMAAVPLHAYAGDVYQGAATPVTAFLAFVPKTTGFVALIRILITVGGPHWIVPDVIIKLMWIIAVLTMSFGNVLGLLQTNVKRVLAYSSVAHTGYMLVGITAMLAAKHDSVAQQTALQGVLFYLASYGIMNSAAFGVLMLLPSRAVDMGFAAPGRSTDARPPATSAETFEDLAGQGRRHLALGLAMAVACFSLTGIPLTVGFFGKFFLIRPALAVNTSQMNWLVIITMVNAAISAGYYLRIVGTMFLRTDPSTEEAMEADIAESPKLAHPISDAMPVVASVALSVVLTLFFGTILPATNRLLQQASQAAAPNAAPSAPVVAKTQAESVAAK